MYISRRNFLRSSGLLMGATMLPGAELLANLLPEGGTMTRLRNNIGVYTERGGTIAWLIEDGGLAVVDSQFPDQAKNLIDQIRSRSDARINLLINTHHHGDHTGGNIAFKDIVDKVVGHANCRANQERVAIAREREAGQLYADTTFEDTWSMEVGSETITAHHFGAAHTNGDAVIHFENANIAHMGDLLFNRRHPYIDRSSGASIKNWIKVLSKTRKTLDKDTLYVFGHAAEGYEITGTAADLKAKENYLKKLLKYAKKQVKSGKAKEDIVKATIIPGAEEWQAGNLERSLGAAVDEVMEM